MCDGKFSRAWFCRWSQQLIPTVWQFHWLWWQIFVPSLKSPVTFLVPILNAEVTVTSSKQKLCFSVFLCCLIFVIFVSFSSIYYFVLEILHIYFLFLSHYINLFTVFTVRGHILMVLSWNSPSHVKAASQIKTAHLRQGKKNCHIKCKNCIRPE